MRKYSTAAQAWVGLVAALAIILTIVGGLDFRASFEDWRALVLLSLCASVAHFFPIRSVFRGNSYHLTNVFLVAGIIVLPAGLLTLLPVIALLPYTYYRRRPGVLISGTFNIAQAVVGVHLASAWLLQFGGNTFSSPFDIVSLLAAAIVFNVVQATLVGIVVALNSRIPFRNTGTFAPDALQGELLNDFLGLVIAGLWLSNPLLVCMVAPIIVVAHRMTRIAHLAQLVESDAKTGLHNSRYLERAVDEELVHSRRMNRPLALVFGDLDHFKRINDTYGHVAGDQILRQVATTLGGVIRKGDTLARFGGEEFVALLPGADGGEAMYIAERMRKAVEGERFTVNDGEEVTCTISVGIALYPDDGTDLTTLIRNADMAMYRAKETRNAVARSHARPPLPRVQPQQLGRRRESSTPARSHPWLMPVVLWGTIVLGLTALFAGLGLSLWIEGLWVLLPLIALGVTTELLEVRIFETNKEKISFSFTVVAAMSAATIAPLAAPVVSGVAALVHVVSVRQRHADKALFNIANPALAAAAAALTYSLLKPESLGFEIWHLTAALTAVFVFHLVNFGIVSVMVSLHTRRPLLTILRGSAWYSPTKIVLGLIGAFVGSVHAVLGPIGVAVFVTPVLILRFTLVYHASRSQRTIETLQTAKEEVEQAHREQEETLRGVIRMIASIIDAREPWVLGHSERVARYAVAIGAEMGLSEADLAVVQTGGLLHDLGKVGIPETILNKPGRLTVQEFDVMREHAALGERILSDVEQLQAVARIVGEHHERYDGTGYPSQKAGTAISLGGRILALADALDAILSTRPYSEGRSLEWAIAEVDRCASGHFDPGTVAALHRVISKQGRDFFTSPSTVEAHTDCCTPAAILASRTLVAAS